MSQALAVRARRERKYVLAVSFSHALIHAIELTFAALLLRIEAEFGTNLLLLGILANVGGFAFGLGALPSGFLVDRFAAVPMLRFTLLTTALAGVLVGLAQSEIMLGVTLALLGVVTGLYHPVGFTLLARTVKRARNVGLHGAVGSLGVASAPALATGLAVAVDWRAAYFLLASLALAGFFYTLRLDRNGPAADVPDVATEASAEPARRRSNGFRSAPLILVYLAFVISGFIYRGAITFIPTHVEEQITFSVFGWDGAGLAGALSTLALLGGAMGWYIGGHAADRLPRERYVLIMSILIAPLLLLIGLTSGVALLGAIFLFVVVSFASAPAFVTLVADYSPPGHLGASFGVTFFLSFGLGSFAATFAGFAAGQWGTDSVFALMSAVALLSIVVTAGIVLLARRDALVATPTPA